MLLKSTLILMFAGVSILAMGDNAALRTDTAEQAMCLVHMDCQPW